MIISIGTLTRDPPLIAYEVLIDLALAVPAHFPCILLVKQVVEANSGSRGGKLDCTSQWEE